MNLKKGMLLGSVLGGTAAFVAYKLLDEAKQREIKEWILDATEDAKDRALDYVYYANDTAEDLKDLASDKMDDARGSVHKVNESLSDKLSDLQEAVNSLKSDVEEHPAPKNELDDLAKEKESDDIVIDPDDAFSDQDRAETIYPVHEHHEK
ncbi:YtxH domain-containing protein [Fructilactobacillus fructivorans]|uniref:YtxH domain-containing protein n=1 Tax=Fructilactobacillus fructivorans TaxID=1614 RepID=A0A0C1LXM5_9LACO|nr:YtxH domain-containing protein [Fructilactobacillus fructivorans]KID41540.1 hypothetical protein LfDm3_0782 [Fructilactobacillus fructivorans]KRK57874.1 hypothetical protein FC73_GL000884 [Fructilactobacillus fructivorans]KRN12582.1 hypothetical protein IV37_GL000879 [Fructilactobacillus fructivorans]KRN42432.1 hypothetical protein IV48_GL000300 [Fructilactobacillus fructivorans]MCT0151191.1 YtxH domain-containing protein [Fructilactobacillus fructivorans]